MTVYWCTLNRSNLEYDENHLQMNVPMGFSVIIEREKRDPNDGRFQAKQFIDASARLHFAVCVEIILEAIGESSVPLRRHYRKRLLK